jgi:DNA-binding Lrp family transcriptional regulator
VPAVTTAIPITPADPVNARILAVSEDRLAGFRRDPFGDIAAESGLSVGEVLERVAAMLDAGTIRRVRQTILSTSLASGALVAWSVPQERLDGAFAFMANEDPFSGHVVIRTTDTESAGSRYRLWTTIKVPQGFSLAGHCDLLAGITGATGYRILPARMLFVLGVGHVRRKDLEPGSRAPVPAEPQATEVVSLTDLEWRVLTALKREFAPDELRRDLWVPRAAEAGVELETFFRIAEDLSARRLIGRFSTFLEHVKPLADGSRVTRYNALFHWAVPPGREIDAGREVGRHHIMTHAYWREGGPEFANVNVMGVAHGTEKANVLAHKAAIDEHLQEAGIPIAYTNVFWGGRSEIKPSEISPLAYRDWCAARGVDPESLREQAAD